MELLRERLVECGWKDEMKALCRLKLVLRSYWIGSQQASETVLLTEIPNSSGLPGNCLHSVIGLTNF